MLMSTTLPQRQSCAYNTILPEHYFTVLAQYTTACTHQSAYSCEVQVYTYVNFPSETITRSGYQIRRKNFGVTATKKGTTYSLVAR